MKKHICIGVSGGIAAYKACDIVSKLSKKDYEIKVLMTKHATEFVAPLTFETLSHNPCYSDLFDSNIEDPIEHVELARWADLFVIVPCSANVLAKVVHGLADDFVTTSFLACHSKKMICPAMNVHMYENEVTQQNLKKAKELGYMIVEPETGMLACNDVGKGKLASVDTIVDAIDACFEQEKKLTGKKVLINAGPTQEDIDPVRFITNHSSGKQGYAIAKAARDMGANVTLVMGPTQLDDLEHVNTVHVKSANDMFEAMKDHLNEADYVIMSAAVADYRPEIVSDQKLKKDDETMTIKMVKNPDILAYAGAHKRENQYICGFAMETENLEQNAYKKLVNKNCDMLIANNLFTNGAGFNVDTNVVTLFKKDEKICLPKMTKEQLGVKILETLKEIEEGNKSC
ncbi:bifunctional phosphopantothenoylcysteine decarboxylase/phosphopantothenate--cysteine ligase CoaBC [Floccifex sp.]|uniref:bifunctional phosphopantothenoylcysteine decarboxylase/phosphopantothenate--cysteine ligase CoaBC n=1 Tax=Floccifex sp. TaxID=2815810 RepID=UPI002A75734D|nr:bifunctional phosphopantothenoylcysteine decarboxylase/phosphopantothenate--cysteine ligase CoaBC [Floccifex sp.]MDD7281220.1 bifunctional phosphopantothenoylcysteine decarboxylase/phosphopantothenate--cysteine ligase CoaBC [Erysipelotrichaceae bacterium]MDY2958242.1 bifunctional phosphopantothenoylcysteine decarboxylase/phosphopantothenate--cysteine ligase CoaBC [Floccifex sp.]